MMKRAHYRAGHVTARPGKTSKKENIPFTGLEQFDCGSRQGLIYVPGSYHPDKPASLAVMLHGAGGDAQNGMSLIRNYADQHNIILLAPASQDYSWDIIASNAFGTDVMVLDQALDMVFNKFSINPSRLAIGGFSDGASYALCIGLSNGDLFNHILAFSPGFYHLSESQGKPQAFIAHGTRDAVLPINSCSRRIVPRLRNSGIDVTYHEFDGEHVIPERIAQAGIDWFTTDK